MASLHPTPPTTSRPLSQFLQKCLSLGLTAEGGDRISLGHHGFMESSTVPATELILNISQGPKEIYHHPLAQMLEELQVLVQKKTHSLDQKHWQMEFPPQTWGKMQVGQTILGSHSAVTKM